MTMQDFEDNGVIRFLPLTTEKEVNDFNLKMEDDRILFKNLVSTHYFKHIYNASCVELNGCLYDIKTVEITMFQTSYLTEVGHTEKSSISVSTYVRKTMKIVMDFDTLVLCSWTGSSRENRLSSGNAATHSCTTS